eukprot:CAMPEP_0183448028 /NCGR_PEP_ID=MMETSP0370-20130417/104852_1 /TAXON_ID=268820 /ORGANISM="Peridinium aciculiferum, Strain PAER-2" /LENGTH=42 /DNA_ID= /DNA_START= /DNA_END= /DNA_ORIENTATION=
MVYADMPGGKFITAAAPSPPPPPPPIMPMTASGAYLPMTSGG